MNFPALFIGRYAKSLYLCTRFPHNRCHEEELHGMLCWNDKQI